MSLKPVELVVSSEIEIDFVHFLHDLELLKAQTPIHYILGTAYFLDRPLRVNPSTLVPRPETEELVHILKSEIPKMFPHPKIIDLGTGSGCLALGLKTLLPNSDVQAWDIQERAISTARENAKEWGVDISFEVHDMLLEAIPNVDVIVSNPPYIPIEEKEDLDVGVRDYEPELALYVPNNNPLVFYKRIANEAERLFREKKGIVAVEIHELYGTEVRDLFSDKGAKSSRILRDYQDRERMVIAHF